jgi:hypothetical protein
MNSITINNISKSEKLAFTAVICTRDRPELLVRAVRSLAERDYLSHG